MSEGAGRPVLIIVSGLPGSGKTTLSRLLARELGATHLRIDTVEEAVARAGADIGILGYTVAYAVAEDNLRLGNTVIADSVNSIEVTRTAWRAVALSADARVATFEIVCSDPAEHRRRVETRLADGGGGPAWADVLAREHEVWRHPVQRIDTAGRSAADCVREMLDCLDRVESDDGSSLEPTDDRA